MIRLVTNITLSIFDYFHKKKIINFLKTLNINSIDIFFDIGAHKGESIDFFSKHLKIIKIYSFEASLKNFRQLKKKYENNRFLFLENIALSSKKSKKIFNQCEESSSSTFSEINIKSKYLEDKLKYLNIKKPTKFFKKTSIKTDTLDSYIAKNKIFSIDLIKMDTEGHELEILKGLKKNLKNVRTIVFEHHYDNMLKKNYTFSDINLFLKKNSFIKVFKIKMPFRKSFEYIYINKK